LYWHEIVFSDCNIKMPNLRCTESTSKCGCRKIHNCYRCPYMTKSPFFMINHMKRNDLPLKSFSCETNDLAKYYCKECDFETDLVIIFNQHVGEYHRKKIDSLQDLPKKDTVVKSYVCQKCAFETYSVLVWIKHLDTLCVNIKEVSKKIGSVSCSDEKWYQCKCCSFKTTPAAGLKKTSTGKAPGCQPVSVWRMWFWNKIQTSFNASQEKRTSCQRRPMVQVWQMQLYGKG
jgi:hypothetical protein